VAKGIVREEAMERVARLFEDHDDEVFQIEGVAFLSMRVLIYPH
jgi:hypothetical protein